MDASSHPLDRDALLAQMGWVRGLARALARDPDLAEDVAQEAWIQATERPPGSVDGPAALRAWLGTVVHNLVRKRRREGARRGERERAAARPEAEGADPDVVARATLLGEISEAVMQLDEPARSAILLHYLDGLPATEVATRQGISHAAARKRISRGLAALRERLDARRGGRAAWAAIAASMPERGGEATFTTTALAGGALTMGKILVAAGCAAVLVTALVLFGRNDGAQHAQPDGVARVAAPLERPAEPGPGTPRDSASRQAAEPRFALRVVGEDGRPAAGVLALLVNGTELADHGTSGADGAFQSALDAAPQRVVLAVPGRAPQRFDVERGALEAQLVLSAGARVAGMVEVEPAAAYPPVTLSCDRASPALDGLDAACLDLLAQIGTTPGRLRVQPDGQGRFEFAGLDPRWSGALELPDGWRIAAHAGAGDVDESTSLLLLEPARDLHLRLVAPRVVRGRVVADPDHAAVPGALVTVDVTEAAHRTDSTTVTTDASGRFALALPALSPSSLRVLVRVTESGAPRQIQIRDPGAMDWGDLAIEPGRSIDVVVRDAAGAPIAGATVRPFGRTRGSTEATTGPDGAARLVDVAAEVAAVVATAPGHRAGRAEVGDDGHVELRLTPTNGLDLVVRDERGRPLDDARVLVACDQLPFAAAGLLAPVPEAVQQSSFSEWFDVDGEGRVHLSDLIPGVALWVAAAHDARADVERRLVHAPPAGVRQTVDLVAAVEALTLRGTVKDVAGRPLPRTAVYAESAGGPWSARTDADGAFELGPLPERARDPRRAIHVEVTRSGFAPRVMELDGLPDAPLAIVLERTRDLRAVVRDATGRPAEHLIVTAMFGEDPGGLAREQEPGTYVFEHAPPGAGTLLVRVGGADLTFPIAAGATDLTVEVPAIAKLAVEVAAGTERLEGARVCVVATPEGGGDEARQYFRLRDGVLEPIELALPVGRYTVQLEQRVLGARPPVVERIGAPRTLDLHAGSQHVLLP